MTYPLDGSFPVEDSARLMRNYRYAVERMMRVLGGWLALTPELSAKLLMGRHVWDNAQHADAFGRRLPELRAHPQASEPSSPAFVTFMDALESPDAPSQTAERLTGVYRVLKPHLLATYARHLERANAVYEPPTRRILVRCIEDERSHVAAGDTILRHLLGVGELNERAGGWQDKLEGLLAAAGGVTGDALSAPGGTPAMLRVVQDSAEAAEFIRLEAMRGRWPIPGDLGDAIQSLTDAIVASDAAGIERWLAPGAPWAPEAPAAVRQARVSGSRIVACARIGAHRAVKVRLDGPEASITLSTRWAPGPGGWRATAIEVAQVDVRRPA